MPSRGGTLTLAYQAPPISLDPAITWEITDVAVVHAMFQGLFRYAAAADASGTQLEPCLALELPTASNGGLTEGGRTITVKIRPGVRFHPPVNREVTADDFVYSIERMMDPRRCPLAPATDFYLGIVGAEAFNDGRCDHIEGLEAVDPHTLRIRLDQPDPSFLNVLAMDFCDVVPKEWVLRWGADFGKHPLGTGPFMFDSSQPRREVVLRRHPSYWEEGLPYLDAVRFCVYSPATALDLWRHGEVDGLGDGVPPAAIDELTEDPETRPLVHSAPQIASILLFMNVALPPLDNVKVRQAISWAIDREKLVRVLAGGAEPLYQFYPPGMPGHDPEARFYGYDPERAKELLAEAGLAGGFETRLYTDNIDPDPQVMESVRDDLAAIGISADVHPMASTSYATLQSTPRTLTMGYMAWWVDFPDPADWVMPLCGKGSAVNSSFWSSPQLDRMLSEARLATDPAARLARFVDMQRLIMDEAPYAPLFAPKRTTVRSARVGGFYLHPVYLIDPLGLWIEE